MASTYLVNANPTAGNRTKGTVSVWVKRSGLSGTQWIYTERNGSNNYAGIRFSSDGKLAVISRDSSVDQMNIELARKFRDTNAWYHIVVAWDTTDGTASDRVKIYINGVRETAFDGSPTYPSSSQNINFGRGGSSYPINIGRPNDTAEYFDGLMSHFHRVDNQALAQTVFGSTDSTTGEWKISTSPSITYTGSSSFNFFVLKDTNSGTDQSGQSNNLTVGGGTLTKTEDCPDNVFATMNPLDNYWQQGTYSNGNNTYQTNSSNYTYNLSTLGVSSGKFYWEVEYDAKSGGNRYPQIGITSTQPTNTNNELGNFANDWGYTVYDTSPKLRNNNADSNWGTYYQEGDIIGVALDCTNNKLYFSKNGTWQESGNPTAGSGGISITAPSSTPLGFYFPSVAYYDGSNNGTFKANFGNGYFGTTAVATNSGNGYAGAEGKSIFNYQPPTGYTALSTKGLNL